MTAPERLLKARAPDLLDQQGARRLLVWGSLAQWLVVDAELQAFLELFDGRRASSKVIEAHALRWKRPVTEVEREVAPLLSELEKRGILEVPGEVRHPPREEAVQIANLTCNLTNACNLRCRFCYTRDHRSDEVPIELLMNRIEEAHTLFSPDASFIVLGGEPFLRPERFFAALERAERLFRPPVLVSTNGTLLGPDTARRLVGKRVEVQVSLDGPTREIHDAVRGAGVFDQATTTVRLLSKLGIRTIVSMVFTRKTMALFEEYLDFARELEAVEARFIPMRRIGAGLACAADAPDPLSSLEALLEVLGRRPELGSLLGRDYFSIQVGLVRFAGARSGCGVGQKVVFVDADGTVYPCPNHCSPEFSCGSLRRSSLKEVMLQSPVIQRIRNQYRVEDYRECRCCPFRHWCAGECRGEALAVFRDPLAPAPGCRSLREMYLRILWLLADRDPRLGAQATLQGRHVTTEML
jgi:radical SAM protein with 4Fe4S-binding SPASM domain